MEEENSGGMQIALIGCPVALVLAVVAVVIVLVVVIGLAYGALPS